MSARGVRGAVSQLVMVLLLSGAILSYSLTVSSTPALAQETITPLNEALSVDALVRYEVDPEAGSVVAVVNYELTNTSTSNDADEVVTDFDELLPGGVTGVAASRAGVELDIALVALVDDRDLWRISLPSPLGPGRSTEVTLTWVREGQDPTDPAAQLLINPAYVSLPIYGVGGVGDLTSVEVSLPSGFHLVESAGSELSIDATTGTGEDRLSLSDGGRMVPYESSTVVAVNDDGFTSRLVGGLDIEVRILGWPGDSAWSAAMAAAVRSIVPQLQEWLGVPVLDGFEIREGPEEAFPDLVAGAVVDGRLVAIVGRNDAAGSVGRQLAAAWFDAVLSDIEWFRQAAGEVYGTQASQLLDPTALVPPDDVPAENSTAYLVVDSLFNEIGPEAMSDVIDLVVVGGFTYPVPNDVDTDPLDADWKTLLDAFEGIGESSNASTLFRRVMTDVPESGGAAGLTQLDERSAARSELLITEDAAAGWRLPMWLRLPMAEWNFSAFRARLPGVQATLDARDVLRESAVDSGLDLGDFVRVSFESSTNGMAATDELIVSQSGALEVVSEVIDVVHSSSGLISRIGLIGTDVDAELDRVRSSFESGQFEDAIERSHALAESIEGSNAVGILRIVIPAVVVIALVAGIVELVRRSRSSRRFVGRFRHEEVVEADT